MSSTKDLPDRVDATLIPLHPTNQMDRMRRNGVRHFSVAAKGILRILNEQINVPHPACHERDGNETLKTDKLADIRTRFLLWTGNLGVMHEPEDPRALDKRVQGAPEVANRIRDILKDLQDLLSQCKHISNLKSPYYMHQSLTAMDQTNDAMILKCHNRLLLLRKNTA